MADKTGIEWTDATWNPVTGCAKVSAGCKHCYAERDWARMQHMPAYAGRAFTDVATHADRLDQPLRWKRPRRIFVNSMSDLFHESVPFKFVAAVFGVMAAVPRHTFQVLTKRPARVLQFFRWLDEHPERPDFDCAALYTKFTGADWRPFFLAQCAAELMPGADRHKVDLQDCWPLPNVWIGVSVEDQAAADERIPLLLQTPAAVRWISAEPLLGQVDLCEHMGMWWNPTMDAFEGHWQKINHNSDGRPGIGWVVVGGESGPKARPMNPYWVRALRDQCAGSGVPFLFKQWGEWAIAYPRPAGEPGRFSLAPRDGGAWVSANELDAYPRQFAAFGSSILERAGKKAAGRLLDGVQHDGYPGGQA